MMNTPIPSKTNPASRSHTHHSLVSVLCDEVLGMDVAVKGPSHAVTVIVALSSFGRLHRSFSSTSLKTRTPSFRIVNRRSTSDTLVDAMTSSATQSKFTGMLRSSSVSLSVLKKNFMLVRCSGRSS